MKIEWIKLRMDWMSLQNPAQSVNQSHGIVSFFGLKLKMEPLKCRVYLVSY
jgi:hypothetical protein